nr:hypothetical protein [Tanacetum cinerariifolium]
MGDDVLLGNLKFIPKGEKDKVFDEEPQPAPKIPVDDDEFNLQKGIQAGSNPEQSYVALAGPNPEPMHEDFIALVYPKVHESLKHTTEEHVFLENPPGLFGTLLSMKNLDDAFTFGDQFIDDKPTEEEPGKANVESKVESMDNIFVNLVCDTLSSVDAETRADTDKHDSEGDTEILNVDEERGENVS